jgi:hypothetical protein
MSTIRQDDRTPEQKRTHRWAVVGTDRILSGWGLAAGKPSYAAWAYEGDNGSKVRGWVESRSDMLRERIVDLQTYRPKRCHLHIYVVNPGHPALA